MKLDFKINKSTYKDQNAIKMESDKLLLKMLPDSGGKIASIIEKETSKEFMVQSSEKQYKKVPFGGSYIDGECSGMDDMFPTVDFCHYEKEPWIGIKLADHGEVWNLKAETIISKDSVEFIIHGIRLSYI